MPYEQLSEQDRYVICHMHRYGLTHADRSTQQTATRASPAFDPRHRYCPISPHPPKTSIEALVVA